LANATVNALYNGNRKGMTFSRGFVPATIYTGATDDATDGALLLLDDSDTTNPDFLFKKDTFGSAPQVLEDGIPSFFDPELIFDVQWGLWGGSGSEALTHYQQLAPVPGGLTSSIHPSITEALLWASVARTPNLQNLEGPAHYTSFGRFYGGADAGALNEFNADLLVDLGAGGRVDEGSFQLCFGDNGCLGDADNWLVNYDDEGGFTLSLEGLAQPVTGSLYTIPTGTGAEALAGGFNLCAQGEVVCVQTADGLFLLEREDRYTYAEALTLEHDSFLVQEGYARNLFGTGAAVQDESDLLFLSQPDRLVLRTRLEEGAPDVDQIDDGLAENPFGVSWARWQQPLLELSHNLHANADGGDNPHYFDQDGDPRATLAYYATFDRSTNFQALRGHYSEVSSFIGENGEGSPLSDVAMEFDVDFSAAEHQISNGMLMLDVGSDERWQVAFNGDVRHNLVDFDLLDQAQHDASFKSSLHHGPNTITDIEGEMRGAFLDHANDEHGLLASFWFREATAAFHAENGHDDEEAPSASISGLALVEGWHENRYDFQEEAQLTQRGLVLAANRRGATEFTPQSHYFVYATDTQHQTQTPLFAEPLNPLAPATHDNVERLFRIGDASATQLAHDVAGYALDWGIWQRTAAGGAEAYLDSDDLTQVETGFDDLLWAVINETDLSRPSGTYTYDRTLAHLGVSDAGSVSEVQASFDLDFSDADGMLENGLLTVCVGGSGCDDAHSDVWESDGISASLDGGLSFTQHLDGTVTYRDASTSTFSGNLSGSFLGQNEDGGLDALLGGFNLYDEENDSHYVTGMFLNERQEPQLADPALYAMSIIGNDVLLGEADVLQEPFIDTVLELLDALPLDPDIISHPSPDFEVTWGRWNTAEVLLPSGHPELMGPSIYWATVREATELANLNGSYSYQSDNACATGSCIGGDANGGDLKQVDMGFQVDFGTGAISNGALTAIDSQDRNWAVSFDGALEGAAATMDNIATADGSDLNGITGTINGVFTGSDVPAFVGGFGLQSGADFVQGMTLLQPGALVAAP
jgi:hypothetical protein